MRAVLFTALAASLTIGASIVPAAAFDYPYCMQGRQTGYPGDCSYQSYGQCQASASGRGEGCGINPRTAFNQARPPRAGYAQRGGAPFERW